MDIHRLRSCGIWLGMDLAGPQGTPLRWEQVGLGSMKQFWQTLLLDGIPGQITEGVGFGAGTAPRSSHINTDLLSTQFSPPDT